LAIESSEDQHADEKDEGEEQRDVARSPGEPANHVGLA